MAHLKLLENKPSAFITVSLSAVLEETEAQKYLDRFVAMTGWRPRLTLLLGGALRFTEYGCMMNFLRWQIAFFVGANEATTRLGGSFLARPHCLAALGWIELSRNSRGNVKFGRPPV